MVSRSTPASRTRLVARSRVYLAALITGGVATGAGLTVAAAHADSATSAARPGVTGQRDSQQDGRRSRVHHARRASTPKASSSPVRSAPSARASSPAQQQASQPQSAQQQDQQAAQQPAQQQDQQRAGSSHAS